MQTILDFFAGRGNKLLRDMLAASAMAAFCCVAVVATIRTAAEGLRFARDPLPARIQAAQPGGSYTVTRSVLDDQVLTGSVGGRPIVLDPCTGREKK